MLINFNHLKTFYNALVHKMNSFRGNWEQNDPTADDYIKNRPFYTDDAQEKAIFENLTLEDYENGDGPECNFIPGNLYTVIWNDQRYENIVCILDDEYHTIQVDGVFYIDDDGGNSLYISSETGDYTVSVYGVEETVHKIDKKYIDLPDLPDNIVTTDNLGEVLPNNLVTSDNIADNLPDNVITSDELADVATTGDYNDLENTPTDLTVYNNLRLQPSNDIFGRSFILLGSASCKDSKEAMIAAYIKNSTSFGTLNTTDGVHWLFYGFNPSSGVPSNATPQDMDSGKLYYTGSGYKDTSISIFSKYIGYRTPDDKTWDVQNFPITLTNGSVWNTVCCSPYKAIVLSGPSKTSNSPDAAPSSVAAVCNTFDTATSTYTWTETAMPEAASWSNAAFGKLNGTEKFVAISYGTTAAYSTDGITWTATQMPIDASWRWIAYDGSVCVAVSLEGDAAYTYDGIQWKVVASDLKPFAGPISVSNGRFVSLSADEGAIHSRYSDTGVVWEESTYILPKSFRGCSIIQITPNFRLMAFDSSSNYIMSDSEGITWTSGALTINDKLENKNIANALVPYIMADENIPSSIARAGSSYTKTEVDTLLDDKLSGFGTLAYKSTAERSDLSTDIQTSLDKADVSLPNTTALADLPDDSSHRTVSDEEKQTWNAKSNFSGNYTDLVNAPNITEDASGNIVIADASGNTTLRSNGRGFETTNLSVENLTVNGSTIQDMIRAYVEEVLIGGEW